MQAPPSFSIHIISPHLSYIIYNQEAGDELVSSPGPPALPHPPEERPGTRVHNISCWGIQGEGPGDKARDEPGNLGAYTHSQRIPATSTQI